MVAKCSAYSESPASSTEFEKVTDAGQHGREDALLRVSPLASSWPSVLLMMPSDYDLAASNAHKASYSTDQQGFGRKPHEEGSLTVNRRNVGGPDTDPASPARHHGSYLAVPADGPGNPDLPLALRACHSHSQSPCSVSRFSYHTQPSQPGGIPGRPVGRFDWRVTSSGEAGKVPFQPDPLLWLDSPGHPALWHEHREEVF